jgi:Mg-chelatase subunit ChlD
MTKSLANGDDEIEAAAEVVEEGLSRNLQSFTPDLLFENMVNNFTLAKELMGPRLIRLLSGFSEKYVQKNLHIPEFKRQVQRNMEEAVKSLKEKGVLDRDGKVTEEGYNLAAVRLYMTELDRLESEGAFGKAATKRSGSGEPSGVDKFEKGDRYKDIHVRQSVRVAVKRSHTKIQPQDLRKKVREESGKLCVVYAVDASASMKGLKIGVCKRGGVALAYKAVNQKDLVGVLIFNKEVQSELLPTTDFPAIVKTLTKIRTGKQTDFVNMLNRAIQLFPDANMTRHLMILTDAMPTSGEAPQEETLAAIGKVRNHNITVSFIGIGLSDKAKDFATRCIEVGGGRLYLVNNINDLDAIVLEEYDAAK